MNDLRGRLWRPFFVAKVVPTIPPVNEPILQTRVAQAIGSCYG